MTSVEKINPALPTKYPKSVRFKAVQLGPQIITGYSPSRAEAIQLGCDTGTIYCHLSNWAQVVKVRSLWVIRRIAWNLRLFKSHLVKTSLGKRNMIYLINIQRGREFIAFWIDLSLMSTIRSLWVLSESWAHIRLTIYNRLKNKY